MAGSPTALQYLDKAVGNLRKLGLFPETKSDPAPVVALLNQITELSPDKVTTIARTLDQASTFNEVVREHISAIKVGDRYEVITTAFNSIRDDAKSLVEQYADGKISTMERLGNVWMKFTLSSSQVNDVSDGTCFGTSSRFLQRRDSECS